MKEIKRYKLSTLQSGLFNFNDHMLVNQHTEFVQYSHVEQLQTRIKELESQSYINEIKAQGISEVIKGFRTFALSNNIELTCEDFDEYLCEQVKKLRAKHE